MKYPLETIVAWAKRRWFVYPGSDIYGGLANAWDLGPYGTILKKNILDSWRKTFVQKRADILPIDSAILMNPKVWEASWHTQNFSDPMIDDKNTWERFRVDKLIEAKIEEFRKTQSDQEILTNLKKEFEVENLIPESWSFEQMKAFVDKYIPFNPNTWKKADWTEVRKFNLMFKTNQGVIESEANTVYLRPETAQWIFVNFKNILDTMRVRIPFGIAQIWKAFRNEITPWNFLYRLREFEQMEIEYFVEPQQDEKWFEHWKKESRNWWTKEIWLKEQNLRFRDHEPDELSHYSEGTTDIEYHFPWGWWELQGIARRTDFDLRQHQQFSGENMQYTDPKTWKRFIPRVIEPSWGLTRALLTVMLDAYDEETYTDPKGNQQTRVVARFDKKIAPIKFAILPLLEKNEDLVNMAKEIFDELSQNYMVELDIKGNIGKRYRRQDEIWTPYAITVDFQSLEDGTVTIRDRDSMEQKRIKVEEIESFI